MSDRKHMRVTVAQQNDGSWMAMTDARHVAWVGVTAQHAVEEMVNGIVKLIADGNMKASDPHAPVPPFAEVPDAQARDETLSDRAVVRLQVWTSHYSRVLAGLCASRPTDARQLEEFERMALESTVRMHGPRPT